MKFGLNIHTGKPTFMANIDTTDNIQTDGTETEKVAYFRYLGQTTETENRTTEEVPIRLKAGRSVFGKYRDIFRDRHLPIGLDKVFDKCVLPAMAHGFRHRTQTKALVKKLETNPRAVDRKVKPNNRIRNTALGKEPERQSSLHLSQNEREMGWAHRSNK